MEKQTETGLFYNKIEEAYKQLLNELMQKDCQRVEFIRGMLFVYSDILKDKSHWKTELRNYFT
jgi:hypothetical protein